MSQIPNKPFETAFRMPRDACDTHCHIFGPQSQFPFSPRRSYTPAEHPESVLAEMHRDLGIERCVLVQPAAHGFDNSAMLDAISKDPVHRRGVVFAEPDLNLSMLRQWHEAGIRGIRFNFIARLGGLPEESFFLRTGALAREAGWHLVLHAGPEELLQSENLLSKLEVLFVIDHMARLDLSLGLGQPAMLALERLASVKQGWLKVSGADRLCPAPFHAAVPVMQRLAELAPDRILWGTDAPHPNALYPSKETELVSLLPIEFPDIQLQEKLLVTNPALLYGFGHTA